MLLIDSARSPRHRNFSETGIPARRIVLTAQSSAGAHCMLMSSSCGVRSMNGLIEPDRRYCRISMHPCRGLRKRKCRAWSPPVVRRSALPSNTGISQNLSGLRALQNVQPWLWDHCEYKIMHMICTAIRQTTQMQYAGAKNQRLSIGFPLAKVTSVLDVDLQEHDQASGQPCLA